MTERTPSPESESGSRLDTYLRPLMAKLHAELDATDGNIAQVVDSELTEEDVAVLDRLSTLLQLGNTFVTNVEEYLNHPESVDIASKSAALVAEVNNVGTYIKNVGQKMTPNGDFGRKALYGWVNNKLTAFSMYPHIIQEELNNGEDVGKSLSALKDAVSQLTELTRL